MDNKEGMKWWHGGLIIILSVLIAGLFSAMLSSDFSSIDIFAPIEKKVDFQVSDIYNMMEEAKSERELSDEVVVVSVDSLDREQLLTLIDTIRQYEPKAIGLDIYFSIKKGNNEVLYNTIRNTPNMVSIHKIKKDSDNIHYEIENLSFYDDEITPPHRGYANLDVNHSWTVVRTFLPCVYSRSGDTIPSMALELVRIAAPERAEEAIRRGNTEEIIDFTHQEIEVISSERLKNPAVAGRLKGKVVLLGVIEDTKDIYRTPLREETAGVVIHAYATQTMLNDQYIQTRAAWKNWTFAVCICLILVSLLLIANESERMKYMLNLAVRILTFVFMFAFVFIGCARFAHSHIYVDYTPAITMLVFGTLAFDIVYAIYGLCRQLK